MGVGAGGWVMVGVSQGAASACPRREREGGVGGAARLARVSAAAPAASSLCATCTRL